VSEARKASAPGTPPVTLSVSLDLPFSTARQKLVEEFERVHVDHVLSLHQGNVTRAAAASGIARRYFHILKARQSK
jgi:hypothetical protein